MNIKKKENDVFAFYYYFKRLDLNNLFLHEMSYPLPHYTKAK